MVQLYNMSLKSQYFQYLSVYDMCRIQDFFLNNIFSGIPPLGLCLLVRTPGCVVHVHWGTHRVRPGALSACLSGSLSNDAGDVVSGTARRTPHSGSRHRVRGGALAAPGRRSGRSTPTGLRAPDRFPGYFWVYNTTPGSFSRFFFFFHLSSPSRQLCVIVAGCAHTHRPSPPLLLLRVAKRGRWARRKRGARRRRARRSP